VILQVLHNIFLLSELGIEELRIAFELIAQSLVWSIEEFSLITDSLKESVIDFILNIVRVVARFLLLVVIK
jgi:hypothetical protein